MTKASQLQKIVRSSKQLKPTSVTRFFKTGKGDYSEHDKFLGMSMPNIRLLAKEHVQSMSLNEVLLLLQSEYNDERCLALVLLVEKFQLAKNNASEQKLIYDQYLANTQYVNNWNLVDTSCYFIVGEYLLNRPEERVILRQLAISSNLWERRIAIVSTMAFIRNNDLAETFHIAEMLLQDKHDLIHKAVGWLIREAGKRNVQRLSQFLDQHAVNMPKTMVRYAVEKLSTPQQRKYLNKVGASTSGNIDEEETSGNEKTPKATTGKGKVVGKKRSIQASTDESIPSMVEETQAKRRSVKSKQPKDDVPIVEKLVTSTRRSPRSKV